MERYASRKFIVTIFGMLCGTVLAAYGSLDANGALVLGAGIGAYNMANVKGKQYG